MIRSHDCIAGIQKGVHDGTKIRHSLGIIREPGTSIYMDCHRIRFLLNLRKINIKLMIYLTISYIVEIYEFLLTMYIDLWHLPATETSLRLGVECHGAEQQDCSQ